MLTCLQRSKQVLCYNKGMNNKEMVNSPQHYNHLVVDGHSVEAIDLIKSILEMSQLTSYQSFDLGNMLKYLLRFPFKGKPIEDLEKTRWYLDSLISDMKEHSTDDKRGKTE